MCIIWVIIIIINIIIDIIIMFCSISHVHIQGHVYI